MGLRCLPEPWSGTTRSLFPMHMWTPGGSCTSLLRRGFPARGTGPVWSSSRERISTAGSLSGWPAVQTGLTLYRRLLAADARKEDRSSMIAVRIWTTHLAISLDFALPRKSKCSMAKPVGRLKAKNLRNASFTCLAHSARFPPPTLVEFLVPEVVPREASRLGPVAPPQCLLANGTQLAAPLSLLPLDSRGTSKERSKALAVALLEACFIARCRLYESSRQHLQPPTAKARGPAQQISGACVWRLKKLPGERVAVACRIRPG
jgi:hypothetical protein